MEWRAIALGTGIELIILLFGVLIPFPQSLRIAIVLLVVNVGLVGGVITGIVTHRAWHSNVRHGLLTGSLAGIVFAGLLFGTITKLLPSIRETGFWSLHYLLATQVPIPSWLVIQFGYLFTATIAILGGVLITLESIIAAGAVAPSRPMMPATKE